MDRSEIDVIYDNMNELTSRFINELIKKLQEQFSHDVCMRYLEKTVSHSKIFFDDVIKELDEMKERTAEKIEGLKNEASELKYLLNVEFDIYANENNELPLAVYIERIDSDLTEMRELYDRRRNEIERCLEEQDELCTELEETCKTLALNPLATELEVTTFQEYLIDLKKEKLRRQTDIESLKHEIISICDELDVNFSQTVNEQLSPTEKNIAILRDELKSLQNQRESIKRDCQCLIGKLETIWDCLEVSKEIRIKYQHLATIYKQSSLDEIEEELKRCKIIKQENIKLFVDKLREQITAQWDKIYRSDGERQKFTYFYSQVYNEDLLQLHEMELEDVRRFYEQNHVIYEKYAERNNWWEKMIALDAKQNEPNRYNNRGGQLLREEKERKQLNTKLPLIEAEIKKLVEEYRDRTGKDFLINGEEIIELMNRDWDNFHNAKEQLKSARKGNTNVGSTPKSRSVVPATLKTPSSIHGHTTMKRIASTTNLASASGNPGKRMHLDIPGRTNIITSMSTSKKNVTRSQYDHQSTHTKRNLFGVGSIFTRPASIKKVRPAIISTLKVPTLSLPRRRSNNQTITNISASRIVKKYRRSIKRLSGISTTDESLVNYDVFENRMKNSGYTNSSVVEFQENFERERKTKTQSVRTPSKVELTRSILGTPNRTNMIINSTRSPVISASAKKLKTKNLGLII